MSKSSIVKVVDVIKETGNIKTIRFKFDSDAKPGQFVMAWIPGIDEIPMSLSHIKILKGITVEKIGEATAALHSLRIGDSIGIRGPYGNYFELKGENLLFIGGGSGMASLAPAIEKAVELNKKVIVAVGAKTKNDLLFVNRLKAAGTQVLIATDDGSIGYHGFVTELAKELLTKNSFNWIYTCGPELMMKKIIDLSLVYKIPAQASLERYMKCGIGICDACAIDGMHVCKDGPIFNSAVLSKLQDFGRFTRNASGRRVKI